MRKYTPSQVLYFISSVKTHPVDDIEPLVLLYSELLSSISARLDNDDLSALVAYAAYFINHVRDKNNLESEVRSYLDTLGKKSQS